MASTSHAADSANNSGLLGINACENHSPCDLITIDDALTTVSILRKPPTFDVPERLEHSCSSKCLKEEERACAIEGLKFHDDWVSIDRASPYCVPIFLGWSRKLKDNEKVVYVTPCGKRIKDLSTLYSFLTITKSRLGIDQFTFESEFQLYRDREPFEVYFHMDDISNGLENVPIECVNELNSSDPLNGFVYITSYMPVPTVDLNFDKNFLLGCECQEDCHRPQKCSCRLLTSDEALVLCGQETCRNSGYKYKKLDPHPNSAVFECNSKCNCGRRCLNRVVQNGIKHNLQVFRTANKGWGLRTLNDIPLGSFVCRYTGEVIDTDWFNNDNRNNDYVAALDYIDEGQRVKRDFDVDSSHDSLFFVSSDYDVPPSSQGTTEDELVIYDSDLENPINPGSSPSSDFDDAEVVSADGQASNMSTESRQNQIVESENEDGQDDPESANDEQISEDEAIENENMEEDQMQQELQELERAQKNNSEIQVNHEEEEELPVIKKYFGIYDTFSVDGRDYGDVGRFLNHSCEPNCRIRNIFIESQDYRFPILAFFAEKNIAAYEELTWDYHYSSFYRYEKSLPCKCNSIYCRKKVY